MTLFYEKTILDEDLGPFFIHELGSDITDEDWVEHIDLLADFWLAQLLGQKTYYGNFVGAHVKLPHIKEKNFGIWLKLFSATVDTVYVPTLAEVFKNKAIELRKEFKNIKSKTLISSKIFQIKGKK